MIAHEPSAVEVITEALVKVTGNLPATDGLTQDDVVALMENYATNAVVAAIRAMTPEQQAEVIGGEVETYRWHPGSQGVFVSTPRVRVRGLWREVQP